MQKSNQKKILFIVPEILKPGGIQSYMNFLLEVLDSDQEFSVKILSLNDKIHDLRKLSKYSQRLTFNGFSKFKSGFLLRCFLEIIKADLVLVGHINYSVVPFFAKIFRFRKKYILIHHGVESWKKVSSITRRSLFNAYTNVVTTNFTLYQNSTINKIDKSKYTVIPLCSNDRNLLKLFKPKMKARFNMLHVSRLESSEKTKGVDFVLAALNKLNKLGLDIEYYIVGDGTDINRLKSICNSYDLNKKVHFLGFVDDNTLEELYMETSIFIMPSVKEGFGIVYIEAMKYSKPCIAANFGGPIEIIDNEKNGYLIEYGNVDQLVSKISFLYSNPDRLKEMGDNSLLKYQEFFSFQIFKKNWLNLLNAV